MARNDAKAVRARLIRLALGLPGAFEDHPWGETVAKVGGKVFVFFGTGESQDRGFGFCAKLPASGSVASMLPFVEPAGYGLGKSGWVYVKFTSGELPVAMFEEWILESYRAVAPKKLAKTLDAGPMPEPTTAKRPAAKAKRAVARAKQPAAKAKKPAAKAKRPAARAKRPVSKSKAEPASK
jgi:predicted DNA-binding protein (MmcQ/YjbR family)